VTHLLPNLLLQNTCICLPILLLLLPYGQFLAGCAPCPSSGFSRGVFIAFVFRIGRGIRLAIVLDILETLHEDLEGLRISHALQEALPLVIGLPFAFILCDQLEHKPPREFSIEGGRRRRGIGFGGEHLVDLFQVSVEGEVLEDVSFGL
jgi:hypothetical protein